MTKRAREDDGVPFNKEKRPIDEANWVIPPGTENLGTVSAGRLPTTKTLPAGVTHIVNLMGEAIRRAAKAEYPSGPERLEYPVADDFIFHEDAQLAELVTRLHALCVPGTHVYIHCLGGHGRTGLVAAALLARVYGLGAAEALEMWQTLHATRNDFGKHGKPGKSPKDPRQTRQLQRVVDGTGPGNTLYFYPFSTEGKDNPRWGALSNLFPLKDKGTQTHVTYRGNFYCTVEHAFHAAKFLPPGATALQKEYAEHIRQQPTGNMAFVLGKQKKVTGRAWVNNLNRLIEAYPRERVPMREDWDAVKDSIMRVLLHQKFQVPRFRDALLATGDKAIVEHSTRDAYWGDGVDGKGANRLGQLLVKVREEIRQPGGVMGSK